MNDTTTPVEPIEEWRDVLGWERIYQVSNIGQVRRIKPAKGTSCKILKPLPSGKGYRAIHFIDGNRNVRIYIHQVVMAAFRGKCPEGMEVNHKNGRRDDNRLENLEYLTHQANVTYTVEILKNYRRGEQKTESLFTDIQIREIRKLYAEGSGQTELARMYGANHRTIYHIVHRHTWRHVE